MGEGVRVVGGVCGVRAVGECGRSGSVFERLYKILTYNALPTQHLTTTHPPFPTRLPHVHLPRLDDVLRVTPRTPRRSPDLLEAVAARRDEQQRGGVGAEPLQQLAAAHQGGVVEGKEVAQRAHQVLLLQVQLAAGEGATGWRG